MVGSVPIDDLGEDLAFENDEDKKLGFGLVSRSPEALRQLLAVY